MIHTILIGSKISKETYYKLLGKLRKNNKDNSNVFFYYNNEGIREISLYEVKTNRIYRQYYINLIINPRVITEASDSVLVSSKSHIEDLPNAFNSLLRRKFSGLYLPPFNKWQCIRIDYAVDIHTKRVNEYIKLFNKADSPFWFDDNLNEGSLYRKSKSVTVNFYDKSSQLRGKNIEIVPPIAEDLLRIEVQCQNGRTSYMKRKYDLKDKSIINYLDERLSTETILNYYDKVIGIGDYFKFSIAEKIINESKYSTKMKNALIKTLKLIAQARSISKAREQFQEGVSLKNTTLYLNGSKSTFNMHLKLIRALGINPVTIPREWELDFLKNIRDEILNNM